MMKKIVSFITVFVFIIEPIFALPNLAYKNVQPVFKLVSGATKELKFKEFIKSMPENVLPPAEVSELIKLHGDDLVNISRVDLKKGNRNYARITLSVGTRTLYMEIPENYEPLKGDAFIEINNSKFKLGDGASFQQMTRAWMIQDPKFLVQEVVHDAMKIFEEKKWKELTPTQKLMALSHLQGMMPQIEKILDGQKGKSKRRAAVDFGNGKKISSFLTIFMEEAYAQGEGQAVSGAGAAQSAGAQRAASPSCSRYGYFGNIKNGQCDFSSQVSNEEKTKCTGGTHPCNSTFYQTTSGGVICVSPVTGAGGTASACSKDALTITSEAEAVAAIRQRLKGQVSDTANLKTDEAPALKQFREILAGAEERCLSSNFTRTDAEEKECAGLNDKIKYMQSATRESSLVRAARSTEAGVDDIRRWAGEKTDSFSGMISKNPLLSIAITGAIAAAATYMLVPKKQNVTKVICVGADGAQTAGNILTGCPTATVAAPATVEAAPVVTSAVVTTPAAETVTTPAATTTTPTTTTGGIDTTTGTNDTATPAASGSMRGPKTNSKLAKPRK